MIGGVSFAAPSSREQTRSDHNTSLLALFEFARNARRVSRKPIASLECDSPLLRRGERADQVRRAVVSA
jgi:hypothetical protein